VPTHAGTAYRLGRDKTWEKVAFMEFLARRVTVAARKNRRLWGRVPRLARRRPNNRTLFYLAVRRSSFSILPATL
jgi:hypothetical protein